VPHYYRAIVPRPRYIEDMNISTHVLDTAKGTPAGGILLRLHRAAGEISTFDEVFLLLPLSVCLCLLLSLSLTLCLCLCLSPLDLFALACLMPYWIPPRLSLTSLSSLSLPLSRSLLPLSSLLSRIS
jgi:hypothetical protein